MCFPIIDLQKKIYFLKITSDIKLYPTCLCLRTDYFYIVKDEYPIIHFVSISKRSIEPLFLSRYVVPQRLRLPIYSIKNNQLTPCHLIIPRSIVIFSEKMLIKLQSIRVYTQRLRKSTWHAYFIILLFFIFIISIYQSYFHTPLL